VTMVQASGMDADQVNVWQQLHLFFTLAPSQHDVANFLSSDTMARVVGHTPSWLSAPSPGFNLFQRNPETKAPSALRNQLTKAEARGPTRTIAHRGTEIFALVGNEIRWSDLVSLKDAEKDGNNQSYRVLKTPVSSQIKQLVVSPHGDYLAVLTEHTVHIAVLPDSSHLSVQDASPLRIKTFQLGPTAHVLEQAPVVSAIWHPLGHMGSCLVTVTKDACVRLWELNRDSRASFDEPELALDLKKLANATSADQDFSASKYGTSKGFSPDSVEMEVAAACFGARATSDEHGWSPMTLWIAMTEGDVYALCPLLPSKWEPTATTIPSLTTAVVAKAEVNSQSDPTPEERRIVDQQQRWLADIDNQEPLIVSQIDTLAEFEVYQRPANPPAIPKLQGPFYLNPEPDYDNITDIFVIAPRLDDDALMQEEDQEDFLGHDGLSVGIVCLATASGKVHICLDLDGVEAQWLPSRRAAFRRRFDEDDNVSELLLVETLTTPETETSWPTFTSTTTSRYGFFLSTNEGIFNISLECWIAPLEDELISPSDSGAGFRLDVLFDVEKSTVDRILKRTADAGVAPACVSIVDSDLGHFVLTSTSSQPQAVVLDLPVDRSLYASFAPDEAPLALPAPDLRQPYQPSEAFSASSALPGFLDTAVQRNTQLRKADLKTQVRFSPATLDLLTDAHRLLSTETSRLGAAAADLFRRCERMRAELSEQIRQVDEISKRAEAVTGDDDDGQEADQPRLVGKEKIDERMENARNRSKELAKRVETMRRRMAKELGGKELSIKEEAWAAEVSALSTSLGETSEPSITDSSTVTVTDDLTSRLNAISSLQRDLVARATETTEQQKALAPSTPTAEDDQHTQASQDLSASINRVPADFRKQKIAQVMQLLQRESALVDAVADRLGKLAGLGNSYSSL
jgi:nucleoporin NUP82